VAFQRASERPPSRRAQKWKRERLEALACSSLPHSPREPDTSNVGSVSDTDKDVTQFAWPFSSPRNTRGPLSDILTIYCFKNFLPRRGTTLSRTNTRDKVFKNWVEGGKT
jgi:hypothetical protein